MKLDIQIELRDAPGQLQAALGVVARYGGNIQSVHHERGRQHGEWVPVRLRLECHDDAKKALLDALREEFRVVSVAGDEESIPFAFLLLGHVFQSQVADVTDAVFAAGAEVRGLRAEISGKESPSAVLVEIAARDAAALARAKDAVEALAKEKKLTYVAALEEVVG
ncbi:MAG: ACT domain-containing protein [Thermoplasmatota archaeon]